MRGSESCFAVPYWGCKGERIMPLPQFLWLMAAVIVAAAATLWVSLSHGVPIVALALAALIAAGVVHYTRHDNQPH